MDLTLPEAVDWWARRRPEAIAVVETNTAGVDGPTCSSWTYAAVSERARLLERGLRSLTAQRQSAEVPVALFMDRGFDFFTAYVAAARCGIPVICMSSDHGDARAEELRWQEVLTMLEPCLTVVDGAGERRCKQMPGSLPNAVRVEDVAALGDGAAERGGKGLSSIDEHQLLAYVFTGGTTRASRCVRITHGMVKHELRRYRSVVPLCEHGERVLQASSAFWGAACLGEIDVALSCGGAVVFASTKNARALWEVVLRAQVTVLGAVPDQFALYPAGQVHDSSLRVLLLWADACPPHLRQQWSSLGISIVELLIASEYWLSFTTRPWGHEERASTVATYLAVEGVRWRVMGEGPAGSVTDAAVGEVGELWIAGPMVSPGYSGPGAPDFPSGVHEGICYFRTGDFVRRVAAGFQFAGRRDMMIKSGGKWVDLLAKEHALRQHPAVAEVSLVATSQLRVHAFLRLQSSEVESNAATAVPIPEEVPAQLPWEASGRECLEGLEKEAGGGSTSSAASSLAHSLRELRAELPAGACLHIVPRGVPLPRNHVTHKTDTALLTALGEGPAACEAWKRLLASDCLEGLSWLVCSATSFALAVTGAACLGRSPGSLIVRFGFAPYLWLSFAMLPDFLPRAVLRWKPEEPLFALTLAASRGCHLPLFAFPGLIWTLRTGRTASWPAVFWLRVRDRLGRRACAPFSFLLKSSGRRDVHPPRPRWRGPAGQRQPRLLAWYRRPEVNFDGSTWWDSSGNGNHAVVDYGRPKVDINGGLNFETKDSLLFLGTDVSTPPEFALFATARWCPPILKVTVTWSSQALGSRFCKVAGTTKGCRVQFQLFRVRGNLPQVMTMSGKDATEWRGDGDARCVACWRLLQVDGMATPPDILTGPEEGEGSHGPFPEGTELLLAPLTGEEAVIFGFHGQLVCGWSGHRLGVVAQGDRVLLDSERSAGLDFHVVAMLFAGERGSLYVDGKLAGQWTASSADAAAWPVEQLRLGVNAAHWWGRRSYCSVLEAAFYEGWPDHAAVAARSEEMLARSQNASKQPWGSSCRRDAAVFAVIRALGCSAGSDPCSREGVREGEYTSTNTLWRYVDEQNWEAEVDWVEALRPPPPPLRQPALPGGGGSCNNLVTSASGTGAHIRALVDRMIGDSVDVASLDSLRILALAEAIRRELGIPVGAGTLLRAAAAATHGGGAHESAVDSLAAAITAAALDSSLEQQCSVGAAEEGAGFPIWITSGLWNSPMYWVVQAPDIVDCEALRRALRRLFDRHPALRAARDSKASVACEASSWAEECAPYLEVLRCGSMFTDLGIRGTKFLASLSGIMAIVLGASLCRMWPRVKAPPLGKDGGADISLQEIDAKDHKEVAAKAAELRGRGFASPCTFALIRQAEPRCDFLFLGVCHAVSDASSFVPLRTDLVSFYLQELGRSDEPALAPLPNALKVLSLRLQSAFRQPSRDPSASYLAGWSHGLSSKSERSTAFWRVLHVQPSARATLEHVGAAMQLPLDGLLVAALACAIARCDGSPVVRFTLTCPMRDGPGEAGLIGFLSDWRNLDVHTHPYQSVLSVALQTVDSIRSRRFVRGDVSEARQRMHINLVSTDASLDRGFQQLPEMSVSEAPRRFWNSLYCSSDQPISFQGWQTADAFSFRVKLNLQWCQPPWPDRFAAELRKVIDQLAWEPAAPVHATAWDV